MLSFYRLPNQLPNEKIVRIVRKDIFILLERVLMFAFLVILPVAFFLFAINATPSLLQGQISFPIIILLTSGYYLFVWLFFFFSFIDYYLDFWIITDERIIDVQQKGFFARTIAEQRLYRIQDVVSEIHGAIATIFSYGDVHVQTAGTKQRFYFKQVPHPDNIRNEIIKLSERSKLRQKKVIEAENDSVSGEEAKELL